MTNGLIAKSGGKKKKTYKIEMIISIIGPCRLNWMSNNIRMIGGVRACPLLYDRGQWRRTAPSIEKSRVRLYNNIITHRNMVIVCISPIISRQLVYPSSAPTEYILYSRSRQHASAMNQRHARQQLIGIDVYLLLAGLTYA